VVLRLLTALVSYLLVAVRPLLMAHQLPVVLEVVLLELVVVLVVLEVDLTVTQLVVVVVLRAIQVMVVKVGMMATLPKLVQVAVVLVVIDKANQVAVAAVVLAYWVKVLMAYPATGAVAEEQTELVLGLQVVMAVLMVVAVEVQTVAQVGVVQ
jgi:hypothetical protein